MSDVERIKKRFEKHSYTETQDDMNPYPPNKVISLKTCFSIVDEELAKKPQEDSIKTLSKLVEKYSDEATKYRKLYEELNNQPQVHPIVRSVEEIAKNICFNNDNQCIYCKRKNAKVCTGEDCINHWIDWLTKKEV